MQVKVCAKCGAENKETNDSCSSCYASLADARTAESTKEPIVLPPEPAERPERRPTETPTPAAQMPPPGPPVATSTYSPPFRERPAPVKQGSSAGVIIVILILIAAGAAAGWWFFLRAPSPGEVVQAFFKASKGADVEKVKSYLSSSTLNMPGFADGFQRGFEFASKNRQSQGGKKDDADVRIFQTTYEGSDKNTAVVMCEPTGQSIVSSGTGGTIDIVLVKEEGKWKIDMMATAQRMFQKMMGEAGKKGFKMPRGKQFRSKRP